MAEPQIVDAGPYQAHILNSEVEVYDAETLLFTLRQGLNASSMDIRRMLQGAVLAYQAGQRDGERQGRTKLQAEMRTMLGLT